MPSLSTFVGFIPQLAVFAFGVDVIGWMVADSLRESKEIIDESMWADWQNAKCRGLKYAQDFILCDWAIKNGFGFVYVSQNLLNKIVKGELKKFDEIRLFQQSENNDKDFYSAPHYNIFYFTQFDKILKEDITIIDSIFINS